MNESIHKKTLVVITGGTIEAGYNVEEGTPFEVPMPVTVNGTAMPELIDRLGLSQDVDYLKLGMTDSKHMAIVGQAPGTKVMMDTILHTAIHDHYDRVVIVQGTDTMPEHAQYLKRQIEEIAPYEADVKDKRFVFTGAMAPVRDKHWQFRDESFSDGWVNMRRALADVKEQKPGVYVQMGDTIDTLVGDRLPKEPAPQFLKGPWEADSIIKHVDTKVNPVTRVMEVERSGFVAQVPGRSQEWQL